ncbi:tripartite tricarboxylate transporter substrate-binding protein [Cupriavidus basilensis]
MAGGQVDFMMADLSAALPLIRAGLHAIALPAEQRSAVLPDVPDLCRSRAVPASRHTPGRAWCCPAGTPAASVDKLNAAIAAALKDPAVVRQMQELGLEPMGDTRAGFAEFVERGTREVGSLDPRAQDRAGLKRA